MNLSVKTKEVEPTKLPLGTILLMVLGTGLISTILLYLLRTPIRSVIPIPNTYYVFCTSLLMFLAQILIVVTFWAREGLLNNWEKLKEQYPYLKFSRKDQSLLKWVLALSVATLTFIVTFDLIEPTLGVWFRTVVIPPAWHPFQADLPLDVSINGVFVVLMGLILLLNVLAEDIFFRCFLLEKVSWLGKWDWVFIGLLFGLYHLLFQPWQIPGILPSALMMTWFTKYLKSVWPALIGHLLVNGIQIIGLIMALGG